MIAVVIGLYLVVPPQGEDIHIIVGMSWGVFSAFIFAILSLCSRSRLKETEPLSLTFQQNLGAMITAAIIMPLTTMGSFTEQWHLLLMLGLICTTLPLVMLMNSLRYLKAQLVSLVVCLEPVYGIILAVVLLAEIPSTTTLIGGTVILSAVAAGSLLKEQPASR